MIRPDGERPTELFESSEPVPYDDFRSGLTFEDVRDELHQESQRAYAEGRYMWVTRATVLGRLREHKLSAYERYLEAHERHQERRALIDRDRHEPAPRSGPSDIDERRPFSGSFLDLDDEAAA